MHAADRQRPGSPRPPRRRLARRRFGPPAPALALALAALLAGCATAPSPTEGPAAYGLGVAAEARVAWSPPSLATCLQRNEGRASYPFGLGPGATSAVADGDAVVLTQWFFLKRGGSRATRLVLRPAGPSATDLQVLLPTGLAITDDYRRSALQLLEACRPGGIAGWTG